MAKCIPALLANDFRIFTEVIHTSIMSVIQCERSQICVGVSQNNYSSEGLYYCHRDRPYFSLLLVLIFDGLLCDEDNLIG